MRYGKFRACSALFLAITASAANAISQDKPDSSTPNQSAAPSAQTSSTKETRAPDKSKKNKDTQGKEGQGQTSGTSNDRLFFALPNFLTLENANQVPPLTAGQKFKVVARSSFDYVQYPWYGFPRRICGASAPGLRL